MKEVFFVDFWSNKEHPELLKYLEQLFLKDNYYAALNSAVFSMGSFCYIQRRSLSNGIIHYFRINQ
jgi:Fe-S cluster assembly protein SufB